MDKFKPTRICHANVDKSKNIIRYNTKEVVDHSFTMKNVNRYVIDRIPFVYLRYNDGEWRSLLGREVWDKYWKNTGNGDRHEFYNGMMNDLRSVLDDISKLDKNKVNIHVGLHGTWDQLEIQNYVVDNNLKDTIHWVGTIRPVEGLWDFSFLEFLKIIKNDKTICKILLTKKTLSPMSKILNIDHYIPVDHLNSYLKYNEYFNKCSEICEKETRPILIMSSIGPSCNILGYRLYEKYNKIMYLNTGCVFDPFMGFKIRGFMRDPDFIEWFKKHYKEYMP